MAAVGGGWMADLTTWPLNFFIRHGRILPYDGELTVYQGFTPSLVSGRAEEFLRVARRIAETAEKLTSKQLMTNEHFPEKYKDRVDWTDTIALKELRTKSKDMFKIRNDVVPKNKLFKDGMMQCGESDGKRALYLPDLRRTKDMSRGSVARKFLNNWRESCTATTVDEIEPAKKASVY